MKQITKQDGDPAVHSSDLLGCLVRIANKPYYSLAGKLGVVESIESGEPRCYVREENGRHAEFCCTRDLHRQPNTAGEPQPRKPRT